MSAVPTTSVQSACDGSEGRSLEALLAAEHDDIARREAHLAELEQRCAHLRELDGRAQKCRAAEARREREKRADALLDEWLPVPELPAAMPAEVPSRRGSGGSSCSASSRCRPVRPSPGMHAANKLAPAAAELVASMVESPYTRPRRFMAAASAATKRSAR